MGKSDHRSPRDAHEARRVAVDQHHHVQAQAGDFVFQLAFSEVGQGIELLAETPRGLVGLAVLALQIQVVVMPQPQHRKRLHLAAGGGDPAAADDRRAAVVRREARQRTRVADETAEGKAVKQVTGEELERMMADWDTPLVVDAYATWYVWDLQ